MIRVRDGASVVPYTDLLPRQALNLVANAFHTDRVPPNSIRQEQINPSSVQARVLGQCSSQQYIRSIDNQGIAFGLDGLPVISYWDTTNACQKVAKCMNTSCTGSSTITAVDNTASVGISTAIGPDGLPVISYQGFSVITLKVAKCANMACMGNATLTTIDYPDSIVNGFNTSIAIGLDGLSVISYALDGNFKIAKCGNPSCR